MYRSEVNGSKLMWSVTLNVRIREVIRRFGAIIFIMIVLRK